MADRVACANIHCRVSLSALCCDISRGGRNELDQCEQLCETALRMSDGKREEASMILAEVRTRAHTENNKLKIVRTNVANVLGAGGSSVHYRINRFQQGYTQRRQGFGHQRFLFGA